MNKKLITGIKYQVSTIIKPLIIFYSIIYGLVVASLFITTNAGVTSITFTMLEINSFIFLGICSVMTFSEDFKLFIQNGMTRKMIFKSFICEFIMITFLMALFESVITYILHTNFDYQYLFQMTYGDNHSVVISFFWLFTLYFMFTMLAYLLATLKNKVGKKIFTITLIGFISIVLILIPALNIATDGALLQNIAPIFIKIIGFMDGKINFVYPIFTFVIIAMIAVIGSYLFTRKTEIL